VAAGGAVDGIRSVASVFISRIDSKVDPLLTATPELQGRAALAQADVAYADWQTYFNAPATFGELASVGAKPQILLWASTGVKNPAYADVMYVEQLIGAGTVNTVPAATLDAFRDHGAAATTLARDVPASRAVLARLLALGVDLAAIGEGLQQDGLIQFERAFAELLEATA
jgi:transaldolase